MEIKKEIMEFARVQRDEASRDSKKSRGRLTVIDPNSLIGKEIFYQTAILKKIEEDLTAIRFFVESEKRQGNAAAGNHSRMG